jgi:hypothetical protein
MSELVRMIGFEYFQKKKREKTEESKSARVKVVEKRRAEKRSER